jgi:ankyrin repeat protein
LLLAKADADACAEEEGATPLHWAVLEGHLEVVKVLLQQGACKDAWRIVLISK